MGFDGQRALSGRGGGGGGGGVWVLGGRGGGWGRGGGGGGGPDVTASPEGTRVLRARRILGGVGVGGHVAGCPGPSPGAALSLLAGAP